MWPKGINNFVSLFLLSDPLPDEITSMYWPPGRTIPMTHGSDELPLPESEFARPECAGPEYAGPGGTSSSTIADILQNFQASMEKKLVGIEGKLGSIGARIDKVETQQSAMEKKLSMALTSPATPAVQSSKQTQKSLS